MTRRDSHQSDELGDVQQREGTQDEASPEVSSGAGRGAGVQLIQVPADKVANVWPNIFEMVQAVLVYSDFTEELMLENLKAGLLLLILGRKNKRCIGFAIFKPEGINLHIVMMKSTVGADLWPYFDTLLKKQGIETITFTSCRKGWQKRAPQMGFEHWATIWKKRL